MHCTDCKAGLGSQHKPSCHRQGIVTSGSMYTDDACEPATSPIPAITDRQDYQTTMATPHHHDTAAGFCTGGCIEVVTDLESGRCMLLCNKCGAEVGFGERREAPAFILQDDAVRFLMGVKS